MTVVGSDIDWVIGYQSSSGQSSKLTFSIKRNCVNRCFNLSRSVAHNLNCNSYSKRSQLCVALLLVFMFKRKCQFKWMIKMSISWRKFSCHQCLWTWCWFQFLNAIHSLTFVRRCAKCMHYTILRFTCAFSEAKISLSCFGSIFGLPR